MQSDAWTRHDGNGSNWIGDQSGRFETFDFQYGKGNLAVGSPPRWRIAGAMSSWLAKNKKLLPAVGGEIQRRLCGGIHRSVPGGGDIRLSPVRSPVRSPSSGRAMRRLNGSNRGDLTARTAARAALGRRLDDTDAGRADESGWVNFMLVANPARARVHSSGQRQAKRACDPLDVPDTERFQYIFSSSFATALPDLRPLLSKANTVYLPPKEGCMTMCGRR